MNFNTKAKTILGAVSPMRLPVDSGLKRRLTFVPSSSRKASTGNRKPRHFGVDSGSVQYDTLARISP